MVSIKVRLFHASFTLLGALLMLAACEQEKTDTAKPKPYTGPLAEVDTVEMLYSDSARMVLKMNAPKQLELQSGDREFPKGINITFYNRDGSISATLRGNYAKYIKDKRMHTVTGNVVVHSIQKNENVYTEELNWSELTKKITTDKFVTIETPTQLIKGTGLEASQDFSSYRILNPTGIFPLNDAQ